MDAIHDHILNALKQKNDNDSEIEAVYKTGTKEDIEQFEIKQAEETFAQHRLADHMKKAGTLEQKRVALFDQADQGIITREEAEAKYAKLVDYDERKRAADRDARYKKILEEVNKPTLPALEGPQRNDNSLDWYNPYDGQVWDELPTNADRIEEYHEQILNKQPLQVEEEFIQDGRLTEVCVDSEPIQDVQVESADSADDVQSVQPTPHMQPEQLCVGQSHWDRYCELVNSDFEFVKFVFTEFAAHLHREKLKNLQPPIAAGSLVFRHPKQQDKSCTPARDSIPAKKITAVRTPPRASNFKLDAVQTKEVCDADSLLS